MSERPFLRARWRSLAMAQYAVAPEVLLPLVPAGTELDLHEGKAYVSLVAFEFLDTSVRGLRIPGHVNFVEVNLRFYLKRVVDGETRRGVAFVAEFVPRCAIALVANVLYGELYSVWATSVSTADDNVTYRWSRRGEFYALALELGPPLGEPEDGSHEAFIIEHYWGYTRRGPTRTDEYRVTHPKWSLRTVHSSEIGTDFGRLYGERFAFLNDQEPDSVLFANGSDVTVAAGSRLNRSLP